MAGGVESNDVRPTYRLHLGWDPTDRDPPPGGGPAGAAPGDRLGADGAGPGDELKDGGAAERGADGAGPTDEGAEDRGGVPMPGPDIPPGAGDREGGT
jgi:hypothetical protein